MLLHTLHIDLYTCTTCNILLTYDDTQNIYSCIRCGVIVNLIHNLKSNCSYSREVTFNHPVRKRLTFFMIKLQLIQGLDTFECKEESLVRLRDCLSSKGVLDISLSSVDSALRECKLKTLYKHRVAIYCKLLNKEHIRLSDRQTMLFKQRFLQMQTPFILLGDKRCQFLSYSLTILFISTLEKVDLSPFVLLLKGKKKANVQLDIFEKIFVELGWYTTEICSQIKKLRIQYNSHKRSVKSS